MMKDLNFVIPAVQLGSKKKIKRIIEDELSRYSFKYSRCQELEHLRRTCRAET